MFNSAKPLEKKPKYQTKRKFKIEDKKNIIYTRTYHNLLEEIMTCNEIEKLFKIDKFAPNHKNMHPIRRIEKKVQKNIEHIYPEDFHQVELIEKRLGQVYRVLEDMRSTIEENIRSTSEVLIKFGFDKEKNLLCFIADFKNVKFNKEKEPIYTYTLFGEKQSNNNYGYMILRYHYGKPIIEISSIKAGREKRLNRGTFALNSIESLITKELNSRIDYYNKVNKVNEEDYLPSIICIIGESGRLSLSYEVDIKSRRKFYTNHGYSFSNKSSFYKFL